MKRFKMQFIALSVCLAACGLKVDGGGAAPGNGSQGVTSKVGQSLKASSRLDASNNETATAITVCNALKFKHDNLPGQLGVRRLRFANTETSCLGSANTSQTFEVGLSPEMKEYLSSYTGDYFKTIETETDGNLAFICRPLLDPRSAAPSNQIRLSATEIMEVSFAPGTPTTHQVALHKATLSADNATYIYNETTIYEIPIVCPAGSNPCLNGLVARGTRTKTCPPGSKNSQSILDSQFKEVVE